MNCHFFDISPYGSRPLSPEPRPLATPSSDNMARLRKQLAKSRQDVLKLETTCEEIRTELAKQLGSVQVYIHDQYFFQKIFARGQFNLRVGVVVGKD